MHKLVIFPKLLVDRINSKNVYTKKKLLDKLQHKHKISLKSVTMVDDIKQLVD